MSALLDQVIDAARPRVLGRVARIVGLNLEIDGLQLPIGAAVEVQGDYGSVVAEVVAVAGDGLVCMPLGELRGVRAGDRAEAAVGATSIPVGPQLLGRVLDGLGRPIDGGASLHHLPHVSVDHQAPDPLTRRMIDEPLPLGVRALDTLIPCGRGQRMGIFAGSGVGKSTLLSMITRGTEAPVTVLALVGERGREVREFIENDLGPEGLQRAVVVVSTSDQPALVRLRAAFTATRVAEYFRDEGQDVLLLMDSLTRFSMAQREVGLSAGEPPATRGYPPSVFSMLPRLLERAGAAARGSITGLYTVLVEGDDMLDPIGDASRAILDGHIVLARSLATGGHFPAIDVLESISRVGPAVTTPEQRANATVMRQLLAAYRDAKDLIEIGAYVTGTNPLVDHAVLLREAMDGFLRQDMHEVTTAPEAWQWLEQLVWGHVRMKRFRFRLEQVLRVRRVQEDMARGDLLRANRAAHEAAVRVEERIHDYNNREIPTGARSYEEFERALFFADTAAGAVTVARNDYLEALDVVNDRRADWHAARRKVAALERLEERRREEYDVELRRAEDHLVDDLVVARYAATTNARNRGADR